MARSWPGWIVALLLALAPAVAEETVVDLELALAVDASASVDDREFRLQLEGIAAAFRDPVVIKAIEAGPARRIAVNLVIWAEAGHPKDFSGWHIVGSPAAAHRFADVVATFPRRLTGGTGLGDGLAHAMRSMDSNAIAGSRLVVDVSGDGTETAPRDFSVILPEARSMAVARGVTINGLAILNDVPTLDRYFREKVQTGRDSFVMSVAGYEDFADAMRRKLLREIDNRPKLSGR